MIKQLTALIIMLSLSTLNAQIIQDSVGVNFLDLPNLLNTKFDHLLNTYNLNSSLNYKLSNGYSLSLFENYKSNLIKQTGNDIRDEHFFDLYFDFPLLSNLNTGFIVTNNILSDSRKIEINKSTISEGDIFLIYKPTDKVTLTPTVGYISNSQINQTDRGINLGFEGSIKNDSSDFYYLGSIKYKNENILPRHSILLNLGAVINNQFEQNVSNEINARINRNKKDFYYEADSLTSSYYNITNNIQSRDEINYLFQDHLSLKRFINLFDLEFLGRVNYRSIDRNTRFKNFVNPSSSIFDTKIEEINLSLEGAMNYSSKSFNTFLRFIYGERDEKNAPINIDNINPIYFKERESLEKSKNNNSIRNSIIFSTEYLFNSQNRLSLSLFYNKLVYDTPSSDNYDDRDEILSIGKIKYTSLLNNNFEAFTSFEYDFNHVVYIFKEKSSNNNINRVLKLSAGGYYSGKKLTSLNIFEIASNYTIYDFEDLTASIRSYSFRQFTFIDSTLYSLNNFLGVFVGGYVKLSEQGTLKWAEFKTKPFRFLEEVMFEPKIKFSFAELSVYLGEKIFSLKTYKFDDYNNKLIDTKYLSIGPTINLKYQIDNSLLINSTFWYEFITVNDSKKEQTDLNLQINWFF